MNIFSFIKSRIAILDVVREYVPLKKLGLYWKGHCPFHVERTASFTVSPHRDIYYCFGCHKGGDVVSFIACIENCSQLEAAYCMIERYGLEVPQEMRSEEGNAHAEREKKSRYTQLCQVVARWCSYQLSRSSNAQAYLAERSITQQSADYFMIGYFAGGARGLKSLLEYAQKHSIMANDLREARIISEHNGRLYSPFEERIIFPIADQYGHICGFGGRVFNKEDDRPKYYNSHDHEFFNKGSLVFGLDKAKKALQETGSVFLVEGYTDCIAMVQAGFINTVAILGTACTSEHLKQLARYANHMYVMYDSDTAGNKAITRLTELCWHEDLELSVVVLPVGSDPASFLRDGGNIQQVVAAAKDIYLFFIEQLGTHATGKSLAERLQAIKGLIARIAKIQDPLKQDLLLRKAAVSLDVSSETLHIELKRITHKEHVSPHVPEVSDTIKHEQSLRIQSNYFTKEILDLEKKLIYAIMNNKSLLPEDDERFLMATLPEPLGKLMKKLHDCRCAQLNPDDGFIAFFEVLDQDEKTFVSRLLCESEDYAMLELSDILLQFQKKQWKSFVHGIKLKLAQAQAEARIGDVQKILLDFHRFKQKMVQRGLI